MEVAEVDTEVAEVDTEVAEVDAEVAEVDAFGDDDDDNVGVDVDCPICDPVATFVAAVELGSELWVGLGTAGLVPTGTGFVRSVGVGSERVCERTLNDAAAAAALVS